MAGRAARVTPALTGPLPPTPHRPVPACHGAENTAGRAPRRLAVPACHPPPLSPPRSQDRVTQNPLVRQPGPSPRGGAARADAAASSSESEPTPRAVTVTDPGLHGQRQAGRDRRRVLPSPFSSQLRPPAGAGGNRGSVLGSCSRPQRRASARGAVSWPLRILNHDCRQGAQKPFLSPTP